MMDEEIRQAVSEVREMKQMCGNINMKLTNIVTQRGQNWKEKLEAEYQRGLEDAWEAARKVALNTNDGGLSMEELNKIFDRYTLQQVLKEYTAKQTIEKLKAYEEKQKADDKIEVGDEVIYNGTTKCVVVTPETDEKYASLFDCNGIHYSADHRECKKTGRHFNIEKILEAMKA